MKSLVQRIRRGDPSAASEIVDAYGDRLFAFVRGRLSGEAAIAEEVVQETLVRAVREIDTFDARRGEFFTWLCLLARNPIRAAMRNERRTAAAPLNGDGLADAFATDRLPDEMLAAAETRQQVGCVLAMLPEAARLLLVAKYVDGRSLAELAERNGKSAGAVKQKLARARAAFRSAFQLVCGPEEYEERGDTKRVAKSRKKKE